MTPQYILHKSFCQPTMPNEAGLVGLRSIANSLLSKLCEDDVQDLFQSEMDADGYFRPEDEDETEEGD